MQLLKLCQVLQVEERSRHGAVEGVTFVPYAGQVANEANVETYNWSSGNANLR